MDVILSQAGLEHGFVVVVAVPLGHDGVVAEGAHQSGPVFPQGLGLVLGHVLLHEGKVGGLHALLLGVQHPREAELRVEAAEKAVEAGGRRDFGVGVGRGFCGRYGGGRRLHGGRIA